MSAVQQTPVIIPEGVVEPSMVAASVATELAPVHPVDESSHQGDSAAAAAPVEETKEEQPVEPIHSGPLGYKAPGLKNLLRFSKKYFWFGEEPVPTTKLSAYLRGEKAEIAHDTAAWSSVTGKGLLYFAKHQDQRESPSGVLNLADATELTRDGPVTFHLKCHGGKHAFETHTPAECNGWFAALEKAMEDAKAAKESIVSSEAYKEEKTKLGKPTALAAHVAGSPKKSTDMTTKHAESEPAVAGSSVEQAVPARTGSSSSSSSDEDSKKKKTSKRKSRSLSRGKRSSLFGGLLGKKDKDEEKEDKTDAKHDKEPATAGDATTTPAAVVAPIVTEDLPAAEETKPVEAAPVTEEKKVEDKPKPTKRASLFGTFVERMRSPTHEKREADLVPTAAKEPAVSAEAPQIEALPKADETSLTPAAPVAPVTDVVTDAPKVDEAKPVAAPPAKERQPFSFGKFLGGSKDKVKSPSTEKVPEAPKTDETPKVEDTPAPVAPVASTDPIVPATESSVEKEEPTTETTTPAQKKRVSLFGALGGSFKNDTKDGEEKPQGLKGLFRSASKAGKSRKEKEIINPPAMVEETAEPKIEAAETAPLAGEKKETAEPVDVVPDAVQVGQAPKSTPEVTTTA